MPVSEDEADIEAKVSPSLRGCACRALCPCSSLCTTTVPSPSERTLNPALPCSLTTVLSTASTACGMRASCSRWWRSMEQVGSETFIGASCASLLAANTEPRVPGLSMAAAVPHGVLMQARWCSRCSARRWVSLLVHLRRGCRRWPRTRQGRHPRGACRSGRISRSELCSQAVRCVCAFGCTSTHAETACRIMF